MRARHVPACVLLLAAVAGAASAQQGEQVYLAHCARCHEQSDARIPHREALGGLPATGILRAMDFGTMIAVSYQLTRPEREAVARFLSRVPDETYRVPPQALCREREVRLPARLDAGWNGWSTDARNLRHAAGGGLDAAQLPRLRLRWAFGYAQDTIAFAPPTVLGANVFVGSASGRVHALDAATGCIRWMFQAQGPVRTALTAARAPDGQGGAQELLLFSDQIGMVYAVAARTGALLWQTRIEQHEAARLTGSIVTHGAHAYVPVASWEETRARNDDYPCCTFRGSIVALRIADGTPAWKTWMIPEPARPRGVDARGVQEWGPSGAGVWATPTVDAGRGLLYVATGNNYSAPATAFSDAILALDLDDGRIVWARQLTVGDAFSARCIVRNECVGEDFDFGASVMLARRPDGAEVLLAGQKSGIVHALDPDAGGEILWQTRVGAGGASGGIQWGMASDGEVVYAASSDVVRQIGTSSDPTDPRPLPPDPLVGGGLTALRVSDGRKLWHAAPRPCLTRPACSPGQSAAVSLIPGAALSGSLDGYLRAYASADGSVIWEYDTVREYPTVNGVKARGGALDGAGPVIAGGMLFVNSGYARTGSIAGNVLLAFGP